MIFRHSFDHHVAAQRGTFHDSIGEGIPERAPRREGPDSSRPVIRFVDFEIAALDSERGVLFSCLGMIGVTHDDDFAGRHAAQRRINKPAELTAVDCPGSTNLDVELRHDVVIGDDRAGFHEVPLRIGQRAVDRFNRLDPDAIDIRDPDGFSGQANQLAGEDFRFSDATNPFRLSTISIQS